VELLELHKDGGGTRWRSGYVNILQTGKSRVRDPKDSIIFINLPNFIGRTKP
jgi:hypothetical protein